MALPLEDGHLFRERFKSEPVNDMSYFVTLLRYIHQNPLKAGIVDEVQDYEFSSWGEYIDPNSVLFPLCDTRTVLNRIPYYELTELVNEPLSDDVACIDMEDASKGRPSDDQVMMLIKEKESLATSIRKIDGNRKKYDLSHGMKQEPVPVFHYQEPV